MRITLSERDTPDWETSADLVRNVFDKSFGADISPNPDGFLSFFEETEDGTEQVLSCAGLTFPEGDTLFLEKYLDEPIEKIIASAVGKKVSRSEILQIGNIASTRVTAGVEIIRVIPLIMTCLGRPYAAMTMTGRLAALMKRLGVVFYPIADATIDRLPPQERAAWGTYYDTRPIVGYALAAEQNQLLVGGIGRYLFASVDMQLLARTPEEMTRVA